MKYNKTYKILFLLLLTMLIRSYKSVAKSEIQVEEIMKIPKVEVGDFFTQANLFFDTYIKNGLVDYESIRKNPTLLNTILKQASTFKVLKSESKKYQAFYINSYNLYVIKGLIDNHPITSPLSKKGFFDEIKYLIGGKEVTLNHIEHELLRKQFNDPRFHFVLVCGALGCPPLINKAYLPSTLESQLQKQTVLALNGDYFIKVNTKKKKVEGSEILKWYKEDFTMNGTTEIDFINRYRKVKIPANFKLVYFPYVWLINKQ